MIYEKRGRWIYEDDSGTKYKFTTLEDAEEFRDIVEGQNITPEEETRKAELWDIYGCCK